MIVDRKIAREFLRKNGVTDEQLIAAEADIDQLIAATDDILSWAMVARVSNDPFESLRATKRIEQIIVSAGGASPEVIKIVITLATRAAGMRVAHQAAQAPASRAPGE